MTCPNCGGRMHGDGFTTPRHCENTDPYGVEPDAQPVYCEPDLAGAAQDLAVLQGHAARCTFVVAWHGPCWKHAHSTVQGPGMEYPVPRCAEHAHTECSSCGAIATRDCRSHGGSVCGGALCDRCQHDPAGPGAFLHCPIEVKADPAPMTWIRTTAFTWWGYDGDRQTGYKCVETSPGSGRFQPYVGAIPAGPPHGPKNYKLEDAKRICEKQYAICRKAKGG